MEKVEIGVTGCVAKIDGAINLFEESKGLRYPCPDLMYQVFISRLRRVSQATKSFEGAVVGWSNVSKDVRGGSWENEETDRLTHG